MLFKYFDLLLPRAFRENPSRRDVSYPRFYSSDSPVDWSSQCLRGTQRCQEVQDKLVASLKSSPGKLRFQVNVVAVYQTYKCVTIYSPTSSPTLLSDKAILVKVRNEEQANT